MISDHTANATWAWLVAEILAAVNCNPPKLDLVRARCLLGLASAEQVALDGGAWIYASDVMLFDEEPPFQSLSSHNPMGSREAHSRLLDGTFFDVINAKIKNVEEALERKKKVIAAQPSRRIQTGKGAVPPKKESAAPPAVSK